MKRRFTLTEVLIAVSLFTMLALLGVTAVSRAVNSWDATKRRVSQLNELIFMEKVLRPMIFNRVDFNWKKDGEDFRFFYGSEDLCRLAYRHELREVEEGTLRFAELLVDDGQLLVRYDNRPWYDEEVDFDDENITVLTNNVEEVTFFYAGENEENNNELEWFNEWEQEKNPLAIRLRIRWNNNIEENFLWRSGGNSRFQNHFSQSL